MVQHSHCVLFDDINLINKRNFFCLMERYNPYHALQISINLSNPIFNYF